MEDEWIHIQRKSGTVPDRCGYLGGDQSVDPELTGDDLSWKHFGTLRTDCCLHDPTLLLLQLEA